MVNLSPDTRTGGDWGNGYLHGDKKIRCFSHIHGPNNVYIQSARLNGQPMTGCWFFHKDLAAGGTLELDLGPEPNKAWGVSPPVP